MNNKQFALEKVSELGGVCWESDNYIFFKVIVGGRNYSTYRETWEEVSSALSVLKDIEECIMLNGTF
jgi:hypothetical protein